MKEDKNEKEEEVSTTAGNIGRVIDYAFNPSKDKIREMTVITRLQAAAFPLLDVKNSALMYCMTVAKYRTNKDKNKEIPESPDLTSEFIYRTAQWQKSIKGENLSKAVELAMAEIESGEEADPLKNMDFGVDD